VADTTPAAPRALPRVMLLSVWAGAATPWHARIVLPDASTLEFNSPFELARYLGQAADERPAAGAGGLR
jgi:hypothetical protein